MRGCFVLIFIIFPVLVGGAGFVIAHNQQQVLNRMQPVEAEIIGLNIRERRSTRTDHQWELFYEPRVHFTYHVDGQRYTSRKYTQGRPEYILRAYAETLLKPYTEGGVATAYYDPENPSQAVLLRQANTMPFVAILIGAFMLAIAPKLAARGAGRSQTAKRVGRHFRFEPETCMQRQRQSGLLCMGIWSVLSVGIVAFYFQASVTLPPLNVYESMGAILYLGIGVSGVHQFYQANRKRQNFDDAHIWLMQPYLRIGANNAILYEQKMHQEHIIEQLIVRILLNKTDVNEDTAKDRDTIKEETQVAEVILTENARIFAGGVLRAQGSVPIAPQMPPTTPKGTRGFPRHQWRLESELRTQDGKHYHAKYPVLVHDGKY